MSGVAGGGRDRAAIFGRAWLPVRLTVVRSVEDVELATTAIRLEQESAGGA
jgi:hypothetical protein